MMFEHAQYPKHIARSVVAILSLACSAAIAQDAGRPPFCAEGERYYPDGQIVELGHRYFFLCRGKWAFPPLVDVPYVLFDKHQAFVDAATQDWFPDLRYDGYINNTSFYPSGRPYAGFNTDVGSTELGGLTYTAMVADYKVDDVKPPVSLADFGDILLYFPGNETTQMPEHFLTCNRDPTTSPPPDQYHCVVTVRYKPAEQLYYHVFLSYAKHFPFARPPFDFQQIEAQVRGMMYVADLLDVTGQLDQFEDVPIACQEE